MSYGVYYVYLKWISKDPTECACSGRYHLCFPSRYDADEFYRTMQTVKSNGKPYFTSLTRLSPQFWGYDSGDRKESLMNVQTKGLVKDFRERLSATWIHNLHEGYVSPLPNQVSGPDWLSGGYFYIRNRRQPSLYWWVHGQHVHASEKRRTKFRIELCEQVPDISNNSPVVLVRKDKVQVEVVPETATPTYVIDSRQYLGIPINSSPNTTPYVILSSTPYHWIFEDLVCKKIGVRWRNEKQDSGSFKEDPLLVLTGVPGADEWELC
ncbi:hypothetical protein MFIFM68171_08542 [Madurella fahalii]|uniref:Uncharacterized protein n=1 Tax=Madurella fahalii TaxID=1157608 RepID=A0ABQ0GKP3_9PEZI